ncbi:MAG: pyrroline-5-carboxylate reductase [Candidatus Brocadiia bacterium]|nr:MAG: pyrroline-5-carboxylate reductase [Candidatus Brocadiia bacterium]
MDRIGFLGGGNMAEALIRGIITAGNYRAADIMVSDIRQERLKFLADTYKVRTTADNQELAADSDTLVLSVKPQNMADALTGLKDRVKKGALVISIMAGKTTADIAAILGDIAIVRVMPNTPALIGEGACAMFANEKASQMLDKAVSIFSAVGKVIVVKEEELIDAVTAVSGSGPAYYFLLMEEMIKVGINLGLPEETAMELVLQTAKGAALLACDSYKHGETPAVLRQKVTSPGGTTAAALKVFSDSDFSRIVSAALCQARDRSRELSNS